ncbi:MAG TPA: RlmE family RNA methyltransferase [Burkholderiales bacterium]|nr:RlmE family RNA methyltransferase [Burkholderiales bacterium]
MSRSKSSQAWLQRHVSDPYVHRAQALGYRSRSAFKLLEIDAKDPLFARGQVVVDLGAAPGGWSQVAAQKVGPGGRVIALDVLEMAPLAGVTVIRGDFTTDEALAALARELDSAAVDLVLSDMAPNLSGIAATDQARSLALCELAIAFARERLKPGGTVLMKVFQGAGFTELLARVRGEFSDVVSRKPDASRNRSSELYLRGRRR